MQGNLGLVLVCIQVTACHSLAGGTAVGMEAGLAGGGNLQMTQNKSMAAVAVVAPVHK